MAPTAAQKSEKMEVDEQKDSKDVKKEEPPKDLNAIAFESGFSFVSSGKTDFLQYIILIRIESEYSVS